MIADDGGMEYVRFTLAVDLYKGFELGENFEEAYRRDTCRIIGTLTRSGVQATRLPEVGERICDLGPWSDRRSGTAVPTAGLEVWRIDDIVLPDSPREDATPAVRCIAPWDEEDPEAYLAECIQAGWSWRALDPAARQRKPTDDDELEVPPDAMQLERDTLFEHPTSSAWDTRGLCHLRVYRGETADRPVVIVGELDDTWTYAALTFSAEVIARAVSEEVLPGEDFRLVLHYPSGKEGPPFRELIFVPGWQDLTDEEAQTKSAVIDRFALVEDIRDLVKGAKVEVWYPGDYTARAVAGLAGDELSKTIYTYNALRKPRLYRRGSTKTPRRGLAGLLRRVR